jgi:hypothetical protein
MRIQSERVTDLTKIASSPEAIESVNQAPSLDRPEVISQTARTLLGHPEEIPIETLSPNSRDELLFVMRLLRDNRDTGRTSDA